jgi:hypothetical protein
MAAARTMNGRIDSSLRKDEEDQRIRSYRRLGLLNGLLIGLALVLGVWVQQIVNLAAVPAAASYGSILLAVGLIVALGGIIGWGTASIGRGWVTTLAWMVGSMVFTLLISFQSNRLRTFLVWLSDRRFWGRLVYPPPDARLGGLILAGFFIILVLTFLAILQDYRLENGQQYLGRKGRITASALFRLSLPLPIVVIAGLVTGNAFGGANSTLAMKLVYEAIEIGRTYEGDLNELSLERGINYSAIRGVREQLGDGYTLIMGDSDPMMLTTYVVVHFDNGAWITCRIIADQLSFCYDAWPPYTIGLSSLISGDPPDEDCHGCLPVVDDELAQWLQQQGQRFSGPPVITRLAQHGSQVLMQAESPDGAMAIDCWFEGASPVRLVSCSVSNE